MANYETTLGQYEQGAITAEHAALELAKQLASLEDRLSGFTEQKEAVRNQIRTVVEALGGRFECADYIFSMSQDTEYATYSEAKLEQLKTELALAGNAEMVAKLDQCREIRTRRGGLTARKPKNPNKFLS